LTDHKSRLTKILLFNLAYLAVLKSQYVQTKF